MGNISTYAKSGVDYDILDPFKRKAQQAALETIQKLYPDNKMENIKTLGESAFVWNNYVMVVEGLGTKNLVADKMYELCGKSFYDSIAKDTVAAIVNDLITVGAKPLVVNAYFALGDSDWLKDEKRSDDLLNGWRDACIEAGAVYGGGETPTLSGIISPETVDLAGSCFGVIERSEPVYGQNLKPGDRILLLESNGIHTNGLSLARNIAESLEKGYLTDIGNGENYGEALLKPAHIYAKFVNDLLGGGVGVHYMVNITGHGFRKLMRSKGEFKYVLDFVPEVPEIFRFIQKNSNLSDFEMYSIFNMGAGFAVFIAKEDVQKVLELAEKNGFKCWDAGEVTEGGKSVEIKPLDITYSSESLGVR